MGTPRSSRASSFAARLKATPSNVQPHQLVDLLVDTPEDVGRMAKVVTIAPTTQRVAEVVQSAAYGKALRVCPRRIAELANRRCERALGLLQDLATRPGVRLN